jgi:hypothetical protein
MITLKEIHATLKADGFVNSTALSFNELRLKLASKLRIAADDAIFEAHKQAIKDSYTKIFTEFCASHKKVDVRTAPPLKPSTRKSKKRQVSESEESESDCSSAVSDYEERVTRGRKRSASSSVLPKCGRTTKVAEVVLAEKPAKDFHLLTIAELKSILTDAGVKYDKLKRKSEYVSAAESVVLKENDGNGEVACVITVPSDDDQLSTQPASTIGKPVIVVISSSDDDDQIPDLTVSRNGAQNSQASRITESFSQQLSALNSDSPAFFSIPKASKSKTPYLVRAGSQALQNAGFAAHSGAGPCFPAVSQQSIASFGVGHGTPAFAGALVTSGQGAAASLSNRTPLSQPVYIQPSAIVSARGGLLFDPVLGSNGAEIEVNEDYRESNDVLYGRIHIKTVGIQHYRGVIHLQEAVFLIREPRNPYDSNAIRVDNLSRVQIGHVAAKDGKKSNNKPRSTRITHLCS